MTGRSSSAGARAGTIVLVTELVNAAAPGVVATDDERYNAQLIRRDDQHESLATSG